MNLHIDNDTCHEIIYTQGGVSHSLDKLYYNEHLVWQKLTPDPYATQYFTIESLEDNNSITLKKNGNAPSITLYYSTDNGATWTEHATSSEKTWGVDTGDKILFKSTAHYYDTGNYGDYWSFTGTKTHNVYGNIMSLTYGDNFTQQYSLRSNTSHTFGQLFRNDTNLLNANNLVLAALVLMPWCYSNMFSGCTSLISVPTLPATTLANYCYVGMFSDCSSITQAPEINSTTLYEGCYNAMFSRCTALTTAPDLPATTLAFGCYADMFNGCTTLTEAPELPATTLSASCYYQMLYGCSSLKKIVCLATDISASNCTVDWVNNVSATGDFYKAASMSSWTTGTDGIPSGWTVNNYTS